MGYRVTLSTGKIHAHGDDCGKVCKASAKMKEGNYEDFRTKDEAEAKVRELGKKPQYCKHCDFRDALQREAER